MKSPATDMAPRRMWQQGALVSSIALALSAIATHANAATFTVNYSGALETVDDIVSGFNTDDMVTTTLREDPIEGTYRFDDTTNQLLSSRFRIGNSASGFEETYIPGELEKLMPEVGFPIISTSADADENSASYSIDIQTGPFDSVSSSFSVSQDAFRYYIFSSGGSRGNGNASDYRGKISQFTITSDVTPPAASVPEPATLLGLLTVTGLGLTRKQTHRQTRRRTRAQS